MGRKVRIRLRKCGSMIQMVAVTQGSTHIKTRTRGLYHAKITCASFFENFPISCRFMARSEPRVSDLGGAPDTPSSNIGVKACGSLLYNFSPCFCVQDGYTNVKTLKYDMK